MNEMLQTCARGYLKDHLAALPEDWQRTFKLMYGRGDGKRSVEDALATDINEVVDKMPAEKLGWAMEQVKNSTLQLQGREKVEGDH